ncbi:hypothetical protein [Pseudonocardia bannensis]
MSAAIRAAGRAPYRAWPGALARVWMRFISDAPEFTWSGTAIILASSTIIGAPAGLVVVARRQGRRGAGLLRALGGSSMILLGVGGGMVILPTLLLGVLAVARTDWPRWARGPCGLLAPAPVAALLLDTGRLGLLHIVAALMGYLALVGAMILIVRIGFAPERRPLVRPQPRPDTSS